MTEASKSAHFPTTHWSRVIAAGDPAAPESRAALSELCEAYWYPIYALIRRRGSAPRTPVTWPRTISLACWRSR